MSTLDVSSVLSEGPWAHRMVAANGARFHVAEAGPSSGAPLVLLLHDFGQFWWSWRHQIPALAQAGYRVAAMDLRGYGASDKPPQGYDTFTIAADAAAVIRCLGARRAVVVGQGLGGWVAWSMPSMQPDVTASVVSFACPHPLVLRASGRSVPAQARANRYLWAMQRPFLPERALAGGTRYLGSLMHQWSGDPAWPDERLLERYADAMQLPFVAHCAAEYYRWLVRSVLRSDGRRFTARLSQPVEVPTLFVHGRRDGCMVPAGVTGSGEHCDGPYLERHLPDVGHYVPEQAPEATNRLLLDWLGRHAARRPA